MQTYTNVVFGPWEKQTLDRATDHLRIAFPKIDDEPVPKKIEDRTADQKARVVGHLVRDAGQGTHENVQRAHATIERLVTVLAEQSRLEYWLDLAESDTGVRPEPAEEPTSPYQQLRVLSELRADALKDALKALLVLRQAMRLTSPRSLVVDEHVPDDVELQEALDTVAVAEHRHAQR